MNTHIRGYRTLRIKLHIKFHGDEVALQKDGIGDSETHLSLRNPSNFCYWTEIFQRLQPLQIGSGHYRSKLGSRLDNFKVGPCNNNNKVNSREYAKPTISFYRQTFSHSLLTARQSNQIKSRPVKQGMQYAY